MFFTSVYAKNKRDITKQIAFYVALFIAISVIMAGFDWAVISQILRDFFYQFIVDIFPLVISINLMRLFFKVNYRISANYYKVLLFLLCTYLFWGGVVTIVAVLLDNTNNYKRDYFIYNCVIIIFFIKRQVHSGHIFYTNKKHIFCFNILNFFVINIFLILSAYTSVDFNINERQEINISEHLNFIKNNLIEERNKCTSATGYIKSENLPLARIVLIKGEKNHSLYAFNNTVKIIDTSNFVSSNYESTLHIIKTSKEHIDSLNKYISTMKYKRNIRFFKMKRELYKIIVDGIDERDINRSTFEESSVKYNKVYIDYPAELVAIQKEIVYEQNKFYNDATIASLPILIFFKTYFIIAYYTFKVFTGIKDIGYSKNNSNY